ncbi:MAG: Protein kinase domain protein [Acidobacteria bacterium]|nr:Protein kinase domain protein [Acidobacteriota bacterium]
MNPYLNRVMIQDARHFFGRRRELSRIFSRIGVERPQSVSVVGERRIGKSSLLFQLTIPEVREKFLSDRSSLIVVYLDFQQMRNITLQGFFEALLGQIRRIDPEIADSDPANYRALLQMQERLSRKGRQLVLLFDEFDAITSNPVFDRDFYAFLRSVANNAAVAYVTSTKTELQRLCHSTEVADSPFFNIFSTLRLRPFEKEEALELIAVPSRDEGIPLDAFAMDIMDLAGLFPFYIQIACSVYFDWLEENPGQEPDRKEVASRFLEEAGPHFEYFWGQCQNDCRRFLRSLMLGQQPRQGEEEDICRALVRDGYLIREANCLRVFSSVFSDRIRELDSLSGDGSRSTQATWGEFQLFDPDTRINQYQILRRVQEGGMGVVYQAQDLTLNRKVAVKVIKPTLLQMEGARKRFLQEARLAAALSHPAITSIYELFEHGDQVAMVMEWLDGKTLKDKIVHEGPQEWRQLVRWMIEACSGLEAAHRQGIIHRDIKSSNLMIISDNKLKILDFGLAKHRVMEAGAPFSSDLTAQGALLGTLDYMSPEQACGQAVDHRSDLFSLGMVLFEGLTGQLPFRRNSAASTLQAIVNEPTPDLGLFKAEEAESFDLILQKLLAKLPDRRYASAAQVSSNLEELLKRRKGFFPWRR